MGYTYSVPAFHPRSTEDDGGVSLSNTMPTKNNNAAMASMMNNIKGFSTLVLGRSVAGGAQRHDYCLSS